MIVEDALGKQFNTDSRYRRIVSLVPSQTEYIIDLIGKRSDYMVVGRTKFCIHPADIVSDITIIGGTKQIHLDRIKALNPDIVICNKEENTKEIALELEPLFPVFTTVITDISTALDYMMRIAQLLELSEEGERIDRLIREIQNNNPPTNIKKAIYLIWKNPYMAAGGDTFIDKMMLAGGFYNVLKDQARYPSVTLDDIKNYDPDIILLSSEPFPFKKKHIEEFKQLNIPTYIVDGEMFSWYGTRMIKSWKYFNKVNRIMK